MKKAIKLDDFQSMLFQSLTKEQTIESVFDGIYFIIAHVASFTANREIDDDNLRKTFYKNLEEIGNALYQYSVLKESVGLDKVRGFVSIISIGPKFKDLLNCADFSGEIELSLDNCHDKHQWDKNQWHWLQFNKVGLSVMT